MEFHRLEPTRELNHLRRFLSEAEPGDYLLEDLSEWIRDGRLWAGEDRGEWVAFGRLHDLGDAEGWVSGMRVLPARRGQGVGARLLDALLTDARAIGITALRAAIEEENIVSRRLFERLGFREVVPMTLRRGFAQAGPANLLRRARPDERLDGPVGWMPAFAHRVDVLPGTDGGRLGGWRPSLVPRWAQEGKLYLGPGLAAAVQVDWWKEPRTLWVNPLRGEPAPLFSALSELTKRLEHEEWQAFLPSTEELRAEYARCGTVPHPAWGDRIGLYEWLDRSPQRR
jgi:GNAT superfamily N-acetyltransferase